MEDHEPISIHDLGTFAILNGQEGLHETEERFYRHLASRHYTCLVIDNIFSEPQRLGALHFLKPDTLLMGTTGTYRDKLEGAASAFKELKYTPKNVIITMGEWYFKGVIEDMGLSEKIRLIKIYPMFDSESSPMLFDF